MVCSTRSLIGYCYLILARMIRLHRGPVQWYYATMVVAMALFGGGAGGLGFFLSSSLVVGLKCRPGGGKRRRLQEEQGERKVAGRKHK